MCVLNAFLASGSLSKQRDLYEMLYIQAHSCACVSVAFSRPTGKYEQMPYTKTCNDGLNLPSKGNMAWWGLLH